MECRQLLCQALVGGTLPRGTKRGRRPLNELCSGALQVTDHLEAELNDVQLLLLYCKEHFERLVVRSSSPAAVVATVIRRLVACCRFCGMVKATT